MDRQVVDGRNGVREGGRDGQMVDGWTIDGWMDGWAEKARERGVRERDGEINRGRQKVRDGWRG